MIITPEQLSRNAGILFKRVNRFVEQENYKLFKGFDLVKGFLILDINEDYSIRINPRLKLIILVDKRTYHNTDILNEISVAALNRLIVEAEKAVGTYYYHRPRIMQLYDRIQNRTISNTEDMYSKATTFTYKMHFTFLVSLICLNREGVYKFKLSDGSYLHLSNIGCYWIDDGDYYLESNGGDKEYIYESQHPTRILSAIKELYDNPKMIKNLAQV